jgi:hypothetical protein
MKQAIKTRYLPCTNTKPSRIKAVCEADSVIISYDHELDNETAHLKACHTLQRKIADKTQNNQWNRPVIGGALPKNEGYCFVFIE